MPLNLVICFIILFFTFLLPGVAFSWTGAVGTLTDAFTAYDQISNKYFYASIGLLMVSIPMLGRIKQGGQLRPRLSLAVAGMLHTVNFICILFLVIHFAPEMSSIFDWIVRFFERMLS